MAEEVLALVRQVLHSGDDQFKPIAVRAPTVRHVLECHEVGPRRDSTHGRLGVGTRQVMLKNNNM